MLRTSVPVLAVLWRPALLALVSALIWCAHYDKWTRESWTLPIDYAGDAPEIMAQMKAASEGAMWPLQPKVVERLGAPFGAHWNAYPTPDKPLMLLVGALSHLIGLFAAANLVVMLAPITAALSFYFVARWLRVRWEWAWGGALIFAFAYHTFHRGLGHFNLTFSWPVPLGLLAVWLVARSRRIEWRSADAGVCLGAAVGLGLSNPYNLLFWLQLMGWALLAQWFSDRRRANLTLGLAAIGVAGLTFFAANLEVWLYVQEPEGAPLISRNYGGTEIYALKPIEMLLPPPFHRWDVMAFFANRYVRWSVWRGEVFFPYLGVIGVMALVWLGAETARRVFARRELPGQALSVGWLMAYATVGGLTNVLALIAGFQTFRATNRVAVFISAIVLLFLVVRLGRLSMRWPGWSRVALALGLAAFGVVDQVPKESSETDRAELARAVRGDQQLARELEAALPPGAMVFQLPVIGFPEAPPAFRLPDYELFKPFLASQHLRFSYGAAKSRARSRWQRDVENLPAAALVKRLESYGFAALYINRRGYEDRADRMLKELTALGYDRRIEGPAGNQVVVLLHPAAKPLLPLSRSFTFGLGWYPRFDDGARWAHSNAVLSYYNPHTHPITTELRFGLVGVRPGTVTLERKGEMLGRIEVGDGPATLHLPSVTLHPGVNVFTLRASTPAVRLGKGRYGLRAFGLQSASIKLAGKNAGGMPAIYDSD